MTFAILQVYCGASGQPGRYNAQELGLAKALAARGHRCLVAYPQRGLAAPQRKALAENAVILTVPARTAGVHAFYSLGFLLAESVDTVLLPGDNSLFVPGIHAFCQKHGLRCANYLGALFSDSQSPLKRRAMDLLLRRNLAWYRKTLCFSKTPAISAALQEQGIHSVLAPVCLDTSIIPPVPGTREEIRARLGLGACQGPILLFVGRLDAYKRPLELPAILAACPPEARLVCIGSGSLEAQLLAGIEARGLAGRFTHIPGLANAEVQPWYHAADALLNLNDHEIFGMSILEALWAGCPVVARHAPGPDFLLQDGGNGFFADSPASFAAALARLTPAMRQAAHRTVAERFLWERTAGIILAELG